jgi:catechol 2,3-dioxygenase-like lactoylglutathione lyase family enzyme
MRHPDRGIDHLVLCVRDLEAARRRYRALGFTTTPIASHPWGTANSLVQLQGNFLELLAVAEPEKIAPHGERSFSFGAYNRDFLAAREGLSMLVFQSRDARADQQEFADKGLSDFAPFDFSRRARLPDGSEATVAFSLAFVARPELPEAVFFTCRQHAPEYFWKPEFQSHPNGARLVSEVIMTAPDPTSLHTLFAGLQGPDAVTEGPDGLEVATALGLVSVLTPQAFAARFPGCETAAGPETPRFAGFRIEVGDLKSAAALWRDAGLVPRTGRDGCYLAPEEAFGVTIEFAESPA